MTGDRYELDGLAVPDQLDRLVELLEQVGRDHPGVSARDLMLFTTAVMEIAGNVVEHGRPEGQVRWQFTLDVGEETLLAVLSDSGEAYAGQPDAEAAMPDVWAESGRGFALAGAVLDDLRYERADDRNRWHLVRRRSD
ncbi:MAG: ATP-binding protein [Marmoricola sp.]